MIQIVEIKIYLKEQMKRFIKPNQMVEIGQFSNKYKFIENNF